MPVTPSEVHYREFVAFHLSPKVVIKEATIRVALRSADLQSHRREGGTEILFVNMGYGKLAQRGFECGSCIEGEHVAYHWCRITLTAGSRR